MKRASGAFFAETSNCRYRAVTFYGLQNMSAKVTSESLEHLGVVAGVCQDLDPASVANSYLEKRNVHPKVIVGGGVKLAKF